MSDALPADPLAFEALPGRLVRDLCLEECERAVALLDTERDAIMAQIRRHEADPSSRPPGWRISAQSALGWTKRVRTAINLRAAELKAGPKAKVAVQALKSMTVDDAQQMALAKLAGMQADALAFTMKAIHGADCHVLIDHERQFISMRCL